MSKVIVPTIGRKIWLWLSGSHRLAYEQAQAAGIKHPEAQPLDASISYTFSDHLITVTAASGTCAGVLHTSVPLIQDGEPWDANTGKHCQWMPYQVGQAAKVERPKPTIAELEAILAAPESDAKIRINSDGSISAETETVEQEIQRKGLTAPRVTPERIKSVIRSEEFHVFPGSCLTVCCLTLANGFTVTGESACASPENFNQEIGERVSRENATNKIWPLEGYLLKQQLSQAS